MNTAQYERGLVIRSEIEGLTNHLNNLPLGKMYSYDLPMPNNDAPDDDDEDDERPIKKPMKKRFEHIKKNSTPKDSSISLHQHGNTNLILFDEFLPESSMAAFIDLYKMKVNIRIAALEKEFEAL